jgi:hypothetical protein
MKIRSPAATCAHGREGKSVSEDRLLRSMIDLIQAPIDENLFQGQHNNYCFP